MRAKRTILHSRKERENDRAARPDPSLAQMRRSLRMTSLVGRPTQYPSLRLKCGYARDDVYKIEGAR
jgi:hypothetical protein